MKVKLEHWKGIAGVDERRVNCFVVNAESPTDALREYIAASWPITTEPDCSATKMNPEAANKANSFCDYWMAGEYVYQEDEES